MGKYSVKTGYMRIVGKINSVISFREFYLYSDEKKALLIKSMKQNQISLYCACCDENKLGLMITANGYIRVKNNGMAEQHMESCPKSIHYGSWVAKLNDGSTVDEDGNLFFNIQLPSAYKKKKSEEMIDKDTISQEDEDEETIEENEDKDENKEKDKDDTEPTHRKNILDMVFSLNALAWEKQTFSIKKDIALANKKGEKPSWKYKCHTDFVRLIYGVTNDVRVNVDHIPCTLYDICYQKDRFYQNEDWRKRYFFYAEVEKIKELNEERKYQYITVRMPSKTSATKAVIRVETDDFIKMTKQLHTDTVGTHLAIAGYIKRSLFKDKATGVIQSDWITLLKGVFFYTSLYGLYVENEVVAEKINELCEKRILFKRPYQGLENYGNLIPTIMIEKLHEKNIIYDFVTSINKYNKRLPLTDDNKEYDINLELIKKQ